MFDLTEDQLMIQETAAKFANDRLVPNAMDWDKAETFPPEILAELAEIGFMGITTPEKYGGAEMGNLDLSIALEEINRGCPSVGVTMSVHCSLAQGPIIKFGSDFLKDKYLSKLASAEWIGAYCLTEPEAGSDAGNQLTMAVKDGDDWILNGTKIFVTSGSIADVFIVFVRTDKEQRTRGISAFVLDKSFEGFSVGKKEVKLGLRASSTTEVILDNVRVPAAQMLGQEGRGFNIAMDTLNGGRIGIASQSLGITKACLDESVKYAQERVCFGKEIAKFQAIQWKLADMATELDAARLLTRRAAAMRDQGVEVAKEAAMAKLYSSEVCNRAVREGVQIFGGYGYTKDYRIEQLFRDARITTLYEGTSEVQRIVIAKNILV